MMKNNSTFLVHHFLVISIVLLGTYFSIVQSDANLIEQTCKRTPNYNLCVTSLKSDSRSSTADTRGLALIMVDVLKNRATETLQVINQLLQNIPVAIEALEKGDPKFAETAAMDAAYEASYCEDNFNGSSPLTKHNTLVHDTGAVAAAIIRNLL
ncbi:hypothetical protein JCGZ_19029 [Jatropha curcas]|uniref:Pectinesterase inhibitor domain-containing protein n=1 Tax=Jatropha curcas TaxID=180498 RepID=A0A067K7Z9_JATCU|nr:hypothetical protein JCGZ_19029 [Jatropha curcas]